jgi:hypothetical protein
MTPYVARMLELLGAQDPIMVLEATPLRLEMLTQDWSEADWARSYGPGKWDAQHIVAHLADVEVGMGFRLRQMVAGAVDLQAFDEKAWARPYSRFDPGLALETFRALRTWNMARLASFDMDDWLRESYHPERGLISVDLSVRMSAGHDLNHLAQLETIARS